MGSIALDHLRLSNYAILLQRLCDRASGFAICGTNGEWVSTNPTIEQDARAVVGGMTPKELVEPGCMDRFDLEDGGYFYKMALRLPNDVAIGALLVKIEPVVESNEIVAEVDVYSDLLPFLTCLVNELRLDGELNDIAAELTIRYEELNLVYHTEDQVSLFDEGQNALNRLIDNCTAHLGVDLAMLFMPEKNLFVVSETTGTLFKLAVARENATGSFPSVPVRVDEVKRSLKEGLWSYVEANNETLVINQLSDAVDIGVSETPYKLVASPVVGQDGTADGVLVIANDLSKRNFTNSDKNLLAVMARKVAKIIRASYDDLTGLINRANFEHLVERHQKAIGQSGSTHCLFYLNVDRLTVLNDTLGHRVGDKILQSVTRHLRKTLRDSDLISRIGGDEFGILILDCSIGKGAELAEELRLGFKDLDILEDQSSMKVTCRIGVSAVSRLTQSAEEAIATAHAACDRARELGGDRVRAYRDADDTLIKRTEQIQLVGQLHSILHENKLTLYSQLIAPLGDEGEPHVEVLLRPLGNRGEATSPEHLLQAAERYQLMPDLDKWVVRRTCQMLAKSSVVTVVPNAIIGVNLSGQSLSSDGFHEFVESTLDEFGIPGKMICFEITETAAVENRVNALEFMTVMKKRGCSFALDDFGSGMSSFAYLKTFPVDYLKIDGELVKEIANDRVAEAMVSAIQQIGRVMRIKTIAEYVANFEIRQKVLTIGIDYVQGYIIERPRPLELQLEEWQQKNLAEVI